MTIPASVYQAEKVHEDLKNLKQTIDTNAIMRRALEEGRKRGKGLFAQLSEYLKLFRSPGSLDFPDYYVYRLFDDSQLTLAEKQRFISDRFYFKIIEKCCDKRWFILADDKFWADSILRMHGYPVAETQAVYCESGREFGEVPAIRDDQELARFLQNDARFPVYSKPINGVASLGNFLIEGIDDDTVILANGERMPVAMLVAQLERSIGQLFQSTLVSHPDLNDVCGRVSTIRVILIIRNDEVRILSTVWKIPNSKNIADNFWRVGNRLGSVDPDTGVVERAVHYVDGVPVEIEPDSPTGAALIGRQLPDWQESMDICYRGARLFSELKFQGWDIGLTDHGPVVVEVNPGSSFILSQVASGRGFLTDEFYEFVVECGHPLKPFK